MERDEVKAMRQRMIQMVLATDMAEHFKAIGRIKGRVSGDDYDPKNLDDKLECMAFIIHMADISNPTKKWELCFLWTELLFCEFFH